MEEGFTVIFDGSNMDGWQQIGPGRFVPESDGSIRSEGGMGLLWYTKRAYRDFVLRVEYRPEKPESNSGVFVRFPDPKGDPWNPVNQGHEIQICDPPKDPKHRTGAVYDFEGPTHVPTRPIGEWNELEIRVAAQRYTISLNGEVVCEYDSGRSLEGYVGLQNHNDGDTVWFRAVSVRELG